MLIRVAALVLIVAAVTVAVVVVLTDDSTSDPTDDDRPAAAAPADLCAVIGRTLAARLVPRAERSPTAVYSVTTPANGDAGCGFASALRPGAPFATLAVRVLRHGDVADQSGLQRAVDAYADFCEDPGDLGLGGSEPGIGDAACVAATVMGDSDQAFLRTRRGADVIRIDYLRRADEGRPPQAQAGATAVARRILDRL